MRTSEASLREPMMGAAPVAEAIPVPSWLRARDQSCAALLAGESLLMVTGSPGTGKTVLVQDVARMLRFAGWTVTTCVAGLPFAADFGAIPGNAALLIDEADRLSAAELQAIQRLRGCSVLLAGMAGLQRRCKAGSRVSLAPLRPAEVATYIGLWLAQAGQSLNRLDKEAHLRLAELSGGIPRLLAVLLPAALEIAGANDAAQVSAQHVEDAAWRHSEDAAARRAGLLAPNEPSEPQPQTPRHATSEIRWGEHPSIRWEEDGSVAPVADASPILALPAPRWSRALGLAGFGVALVLVTGAGFGAAQYWPRQALTMRDIPAAVVPRTATVTATATAPAEPLRAEIVALPFIAEGEPLAETATPLKPEPLSAVPIQTAVASPPTASPALAAPPVQLEAKEALSTSAAVADTAAANAPWPAEIQNASEAPASLNRPRTDPPRPAAAPSAQPVSPNPNREVLSPAVVDILTRRGNEMLALGDYSAARLLFSRAAASGSAAAMIAMGRTYDPAALAGPGPIVGADPSIAAQWYRLASTSGSSEASVLLQRVEHYTAK